MWISEWVTEWLDMSICRRLTRRLIVITAHVSKKELGSPANCTASIIPTAMHDNHFCVPELCLH